MAPKKKKKPASNPARGFATTSTVSKPKSHDLDEGTPSISPGGIDQKLDPTHSELENFHKAREEPERELYELTPDELEEQLEESSLQTLLATHGDKSRKDASRQASKFQTERRLLRSQAERLKTRHWLPQEVMQVVTDLLEAQSRDGNLFQNESDVQFISKISEHDLLIKLWTLRRVLLQLEFSEERTQLAFHNLLKSRDFSDNHVTSATKDAVWGLDECLNWLALTTDSEDMPKFDSPITNGHTTRTLEYQRSGAVAVADTPTTTPTDSRPPTPSSKNITGPQSSTPDDPGPETSPSESDSDLEPDQMVTNYLALQSRLYDLRPESVRVNGRKQNHATYKQPSGNDPLDPKINRKIARLTAKLNKIKSDILFDQDEANKRWEDIQIQLARDLAERKRLGILHEQELQHLSQANTSSNGEKVSDPTDENEDPDAMLGELFSSLPEITTGSGTGTSSMSVTAAGGNTIQVKDFGRWTSIGPRRILEEACKARDSSSRFLYKLVSLSTFSNRHSLEIRWSKDQETISATPIDSLACEGDSRSAKIEMISISCPDAIQSEAYISTVALFLVFGSSPKEEKAHLRLPPVWRDLWTELSELRKDQDDAKERKVLRELRSIITEHSKTSVDEESACVIRETAKSRKSREGLIDDERLPPTGLSEDLKAIWASKVITASYQQMLKSRQDLPIWNFKEKLLESIANHQVIIVCGETGCGKSTQVPSFILESELLSGRPCKVYCTEPRRISAISLARRVSEELGEKKTDVGTSRSLVGYAIRLESKITSLTRLVYATTGIVMRMLERSDDLQDITHLVLDEVHERSIDSDFLLIVLRKLLVRRSALKVVLMSATVDARKFSNYLDQAPILTVPGRTFPVETKFLEDAVEVTNFTATSGGSQIGEFLEDEDIPVDTIPKSVSVDGLKGYSARALSTLAKLDEYRISYDLIVKLLETIATTAKYAEYSKAVLVFLPGIAEIRRLNDMLIGNRTFTHGWNFHALHSTIATEEQERAFQVPPEGVRKIVLATNIAETGITIPDVTCVIDTGKHKEMRFDERRQLSRLIESFISRANAKQRRGRAGRVQKGLCFHLFTKARHDNIMPEEQTPEMLRLSLQDLVLRVKICKLGGIEKTLSEALDPPSSRNIQRAIDSLVDVKALTAMEDLTPLGRQLARLPLDVFLGKLILLGTIFRCLDAMLTIAALLSSKSPFSAPMGARAQADLARLAFKKGDSDLLTVYNAYNAWRRICTATGMGMSEQQFCRKNFLSQQILSNIEDLKAQLTTSLLDAGFMTLDQQEKSSLNRVRFYSRKRNFVEIPNRYNVNSSNDLILNSVVSWSFYPKLLRREGKGWRNIANNQSVSLHPTSVNKGVDRPPQSLSFYHIMQSSNKFYNAHETSPVENFAIALVCGDAEFKMFAGVIVIDGNRVRFSLDDWKTMVAIKALRTQIRQIMSQSFRNPGCPLSTQQQAWLDIWQRIFSNVNDEA